MRRRDGIIPVEFDQLAAKCICATKHSDHEGDLGIGDRQIGWQVRHQLGTYLAPPAPVIGESIHAGEDTSPSLGATMLTNPTMAGHPYPARTHNQMVLGTANSTEETTVESQLSTVRSEGDL